MPINNLVADGPCPDAVATRATTCAAQDTEHSCNSKAFCEFLPDGVRASTQPVQGQIDARSVCDSENPPCFCFSSFAGGGITGNKHACMAQGLQATDEAFLAKCAWIPAEFGSNKANPGKPVGVSSIYEERISHGSFPTGECREFDCYDLDLPGIQVLGRGEIYSADFGHFKGATPSPNGASGGIPFDVEVSGKAACMDNSADPVSIPAGLPVAARANPRCAVFNSGSCFKLNSVDSAAIRFAPIVDLTERHQLLPNIYDEASCLQQGLAGEYIWRETGSYCLRSGDDWSTGIPTGNPPTGGNNASPKSRSTQCSEVNVAPICRGATGAGLSPFTTESTGDVSAATASGNPRFNFDVWGAVADASYDSAATSEIESCRTACVAVDCEFGGNCCRLSNTLVAVASQSGAWEPYFQTHTQADTDLYEKIQNGQVRKAYRCEAFSSCEELSSDQCTGYPDCVWAAVSTDSKVGICLDAATAPATPLVSAEAKQCYSLLNAAACLEAAGEDGSTLCALRGPDQFALDFPGCRPLTCADLGTDEERCYQRPGCFFDDNQCQDPAPTAGPGSTASQNSGDERLVETSTCDLAFSTGATCSSFPPTSPCCQGNPTNSSRRVCTAESNRDPSTNRIRQTCVEHSLGDATASHCRITPPDQCLAAGCKLTAESSGSDGDQFETDVFLLQTCEETFNCAMLAGQASCDEAVDSQSGQQLCAFIPATGCSPEACVDARSDVANGRAGTCAPRVSGGVIAGENCPATPTAPSDDCACSANFVDDSELCSCDLKRNADGSKQCAIVEKLAHHPLCLSPYDSCGTSPTVREYITAAGATLKSLQSFDAQDAAINTKYGFGPSAAFDLFYDESLKCFEALDKSSCDGLKSPNGAPICEFDAHVCLCDAPPDHYAAAATPPFLERSSTECNAVNTGYYFGAGIDSWTAGKHAVGRATKFQCDLAPSSDGCVWLENGSCQSLPNADELRYTAPDQAISRFGIYGREACAAIPNSTFIPAENVGGCHPKHYDEQQHCRQVNSAAECQAEAAVAAGCVYLPTPVAAVKECIAFTDNEVEEACVSNSDASSCFADESGCAVKLAIGGDSLCETDASDVPETSLREFCDCFDSVAECTAPKDAAGHQVCSATSGSAAGQCTTNPLAVGFSTQNCHEEVDESSCTSYDSCLWNVIVHVQCRPTGPCILLDEMACSADPQCINTCDPDQSFTFDEPQIQQTEAYFGRCRTPVFRYATETGGEIYRGSLFADECAFLSFDDCPYGEAQNVDLAPTDGASVQDSCGAICDAGPTQCSAILGQSSCIGVIACTWNSDLFACFAIDEEIPCDRFSFEGDKCPQSRCTFDNATSACYPPRRRDPVRPLLHVGHMPDWAVLVRQRAPSVLPHRWNDTVH